MNGILKTCTDLLTEDIIHEGWQYTLGDSKAFYIRGASWFKTNVLDETTKITSFMSRLPEFEKRVRSDHPDWMVPGFKWKKDFSGRQAINGLAIRKRKPLKFDKAVKTIHLCHIAAEELKKEGVSTVEPQEIYQKMRIEPAVFYFRDWDQKALLAALAESEAVLGDLADDCGQTHKLVFEDMAKGRTVTKKLINRVEKAASKKKDVKLSLGSAQFKSRDGRVVASDRETLQDDDQGAGTAVSDASSQEQKSSG